MLTGRRLLLAVTGGVAAYKSAFLARRLVEGGAEVKVMLTESALEFVGPQTYAAITGSQPHVALFGEDMVSPHTELARWCELAVVAPATAATLGKLSAGISDNLVVSTLLATKAPVLIAPAMHTEMWEHPATRRNMETLRGYGYIVVGPETGALAGGDEGIGRMSEPEAILEAIETALTPSGPSLRVLVTAGGTREPVDPVRYLGNRSSGKMGHAVADEAARRGHMVTLVTTSALPTHPAVKVVAVETAEEMLQAVEGTPADVAVMAAAVADFRPTTSGAEKIPRSQGLESIPLSPTPDILASVVARQPRPVVVGFAAETGDVERAVEKAKRKDVDLLVYNDVTEPGSGFGTDTNRVVVIDAGGGTEQWPLMTKSEVAAKLLDRALGMRVSDRP
ncbi:MAG: bifunctional phosphopantothenoylcysteine decarboxylase/phosphopantothenate--cysteine ligase CoaBC [Actinobacteria bacterium]|nr:bifunctional phosphopantothenoylcysteine decarboxylase/phosphopantothenate--cysteine ligase CoaBC [Actinomycetota bacterium]MCI0544286.1 bifunctional phosphopantothenoylcysteine decarboxylase/phosphopantothenate--cysteine ligase CoaBC [Actinomycetota bacterium]MCI0678050.1 bifunctional phosphopantothenoylcysteine decarboxylase/phosphopantothenate--cysteine ligase CoaBC [Actinomycetota bacterium]